MALFRSKSMYGIIKRTVNGQNNSKLKTAFSKCVFKSAHYRKETKSVRCMFHPKMKHADMVKREQQRKLKREGETITTKSLNY